MLKLVPPHTVGQALAQQGLNPEDLLLCTSTDVNRLGSYEPQWLAVTQERIVVLTEEDAPETLFTMHVKDPSEYRCQSMIGSGLLQARIDGTYVDVL